MLHVVAFLHLNIVFAILLQLIVQASDNGYPALYDTETVTVSVTRNTLPPTFVQRNYTTTILETQRLGDAIITVTATDPDSLFVSQSKHSNGLILS